MVPNPVGKWHTCCRFLKFLQLSFSLKQTRINGPAHLGAHLHSSKIKLMYISSIEPMDLEHQEVKNTREAGMKILMPGFSWVWMYVQIFKIMVPFHLIKINSWQFQFFRWSMVEGTASCSCNVLLVFRAQSELFDGK